MLFVGEMQEKVVAFLANYRSNSCFEVRFLDKLMRKVVVASLRSLDMGAWARQAVWARQGCFGEAGCFIDVHRCSVGDVGAGARTKSSSAIAVSKKNEYSRSYLGCCSWGKSLWVEVRSCWTSVCA